jgi:hypothetical protein
MGVLVVTKLIYYREDLSLTLVRIPELSWFLFDDKHDSTAKPAYFVPSTPNPLFASLFI